MDSINRQQQLAQIMPEVPECFHKAVCDTLHRIIAQEKQEKRGNTASARGIWRSHGRRALVYALLLSLLLGTAAFAAYHWQIFDALGHLLGSAPQTADRVMQSDLAHITVNGVDITVREAGYDGKTLFIQYAYRMNDVDTPLGMYRDGGTGEGIAEQDLQLLQDRNVGWWIDHLWIDGKCVDMPVNSGAVTSGSTIPGEIVQTEYWRLDNLGIKLSGKVEVSLPIGERQPLENYSLRAHPEQYDEDGNLKLPEAGMVSFTVDTADMLDQVRVEHPNVPVKGENVTAQVREVCYSPLMTYITLKLEGDPDAIAAYKAENGEGFYSEDGKTLLWEYGGMDVFGGWVNSLALVDGNGVPLFPGFSGSNGCGNEWAEFVYPYIEKVPEELYLAPMEGEEADMAQAIKVK